MPGPRVAEVDAAPIQSLHKLAGAPDLNQRTLERARDFRSGDDQGTASVRHHTAIHAADRVRYHGRSEHLVHGEHLAQHGVRIVLGMMRCGHLDPGELLGGCPELVHVASGHQGIAVDGERAKRRFKRLVGNVRAKISRLKAAGCLGPWASGERDQGDVAMSCSDGLGRVRDVNQIGRATGLGGVDVARTNAHVLDHAERAQPGGIARAEVAVNIGQCEPGVADCAERALHVQLSHALVRRETGGVLIRTNDVGLASNTHRVGFRLMAGLTALYRIRTHGSGRECGARNGP